ncbi:MAG: GNAT family N-acetyltransferase [Roseiflexaceae bacterium]
MLQRAVAPINIALRQGGMITIRPLEEADRQPLMEFGRSLPQDDWLYLEDDLRNPDIITRLVNAHQAENWRQIVAVDDDGQIAGYSAVRRLAGWSSHVADIQLIISERYRRHGLGTALARSIFDAARDLGAAKVIVEVLEEQTAGQAIFVRMGFHFEGRFLDHVRDRTGGRHNLVVLAYHVS